MSSQQRSAGARSASWLHCREVGGYGCQSAARGVDRQGARPGCWPAGRRRSEGQACRAELDGGGGPAPQIGGDLLAGAEEARRNLRWSTGTVVENRAASADGNVRLMVMSVEDHVDYLEGRKVKRIQKAPRWIDDYKLPGQFVAVRPLGSDVSDNEPSPKTWKLLAISSSPYEARRESALLDASIIEILTDRGGEDDILGDLAPGGQIEVSQALGRGFASLFSSYVGLPSALEDRRPLLMLCAGTPGLSPLRSVLKWAPVQALATTRPIAIVYIAHTPVSAACLQEWDAWRDMGVKVVTLYLRQDGDEDVSDGRVKDLLETSIFESNNGLSDLMGGSLAECAVLMSGLPGSVATDIANRLAQQGVARERLLFCEFF
ncbi:unnamed protein product [Ostreobium quekettii]|uniref:FAD-binding FR-type domain-containing protein n=1 Tax=Ostreobium quekettii TaxID=121088 RepID=A0A8S1J1P7_9CHLO|nr:unnamed protein product [Ostreobium quekettii]